MSERYLIGIVAAAFLVREVWTLIEWQQGIFYPFPFSDQGISRASYVWIACTNIFLMCLLFALSAYSNKAHTFFVVLFWVQVAEFAEYFLNYNEPWFKLNQIPVNVTTLRYVIMLITGIWTIAWKI